MEEAKKVLIITPFNPHNIGGAETFCQDLAKGLSKKYLVHICTIKWTKPVLWQGMDWCKGLVLASKLFLPLVKMLVKYHYEKVYALGFIPSFLCVMLNVKFNSVMLALYDFKKPIWLTYIMNRADRIFVEGFRGETDMLNLGVRKEKIVKFQHWCDQNTFRYVPKNNKAMKVLFVGRPIPIKGKHIIQACERITKGIEYEYIENVPYHDLPKYYQMADVVVVPSLYSEGFSRVVIEAASCGCALVTSDKGALPELVGGFGKCIDPNPISFAKVLIELKNNRQGLERIQYNTALYALQNFSKKNTEVFI